MTDIEDVFNSSPEPEDNASAFDAPNLSPQDYAEHTAQVIARILESTGLIEIVEVHASVGQVHLLGRVKAENEKRYVDTVVKNSLLAMRKVCDGFIGKQYLLREDRMVFGWVFSFGSEDLKRAAQAVADALDTLVPRREVMEAPLIGPPSPQSGGQTSGRRGASTIGRV
jgi:hypothetical protein